MRTKIVVYLSEWHLNSPAFQFAVIDPLSPYMNIEVRTFDSQKLLTGFDETLPAVFCMCLPPRGLLKKANTKLVWIPMWDWVFDFGQSWWNLLPKSLRIVAFSQSVARHAQAAGLEVLSLRYFMDPEKFELANWNSKRVMFYWNRVGLLTRDVLAQLCKSLDVDELLFGEKSDGTRGGYILPDRLGTTRVSTIPAFVPRNQFIDITRATNIFLAPRAIEGIGMTFLEGLARGCALFAYDSPTLNEYIFHLKNGYLWRNQKKASIRLGGHGCLTPRGYLWGRHGARLINLVESACRKSKRLISLIRGNYAWRPVDVDLQDWGEISKLDLRSLGLQARQDHYLGYAEWKNRISEYASFISNW